MKTAYVGLLGPRDGIIDEVPRENTNYRRIEMTGMDWIPYAEYLIVNCVEAQFPEALKDWGLITHFGVFDSLVGGDLVGVGKLISPFEVIERLSVSFEPGNLRIEIRDDNEINLENEWENTDG